MSHKRTFPRLQVQDLSLQVHLGCTAEERAKLQEVRISVDLEFPETPAGEQTDQLEHTVCYGDVCCQLQNLVSHQEFNLVEKIAGDCFNLLKGIFPDLKIQIRVHKLHPPIENLLAGVQYTCGDTLG